MNFMELRETFKKLGCDNDKKLLVATRMYMDMVERDTMHEVSKCYDKELDTLYLLCQPKGNSDLRIYVGIPNHELFSLHELQRIRNKLISEKENINLFISVVDTSGTILSYRIDDGFRELEIDNSSPMMSQEIDESNPMASESLEIQNKSPVPSTSQENFD